MDLVGEPTAEVKREAQGIQKDQVAVACGPARCYDEFRQQRGCNQDGAHSYLAGTSLAMAHQHVDDGLADGHTPYPRSGSPRCPRSTMSVAVLHVVYALCALCAPYV